jgi:rare lipoprotein A
MNTLSRKLVTTAGLCVVAAFAAGPATALPLPAKAALRARLGMDVGRGQASYYGPGLYGKRTASGERFDRKAMTAAHRTLPFGTRVRVQNLRTGRSVVVRVNDRGPFVGDRIIDLSEAAGRVIGLSSTGSGTAPVRISLL